MIPIPLQTELTNQQQNFSISNAALVAEANKTIGTGHITPIKHRDMLSTEVTVGDEFFASDGVVNTSYDDLVAGDKVYVDVSAVHSGTEANGLSVTIEVQKTAITIA